MLNDSGAMTKEEKEEFKLKWTEVTSKLKNAYVRVQAENDAYEYKKERDKRRNSSGKTF